MAHGEEISERLLKVRNLAAQIIEIIN